MFICVICSPFSFFCLFRLSSPRLNVISFLSITNTHIQTNSSLGISYTQSCIKLERKIRPHFKKYMYCINPAFPYIIYVICISRAIMTCSQNFTRSTSFASIIGTICHLKTFPLPISLYTFCFYFLAFLSPLIHFQKGHLRRANSKIARFCEKG